MTAPPPAARGPMSGASRLADDTRRRFLTTIVARVPLDQLVEVHLFAPIRQSGLETGVAVIAARRAEPATDEACDPTEDAARDEPVLEPAPDVSETAARRHTVFTARYRLAIKGPDRGRWDADVVEEADAPLVTVEAVVRGVQRRAGDAADPERLGTQAVAGLVA